MNKKAGEDAVSVITTLSDSQLAVEHTRLKAGTVGQGFEKEYLPQVLAMVEKEMKSRKMKIKEASSHEDSNK